jgi:ATP-dependent RNA helicase RhlE
LSQHDVGSCAEVLTLVPRAIARGYCLPLLQISVTRRVWRAASYYFARTDGALFQWIKGCCGPLDVLLEYFLFKSFELNEALLGAVAAAGYTQPTPIQQQAIPAVLSGRDLLAAAQTGTGKTAAFALPILHRLHTANAAPQGPRAPRVLVLVPTRELAAQVEESFREYGAKLAQRTLLVFGGVSPKPQIDGLRRGCDIIVATPGRLLDHLQERVVDLTKINTLVLDEADRMLDMGFIRPIRKVIAALPKQRQNLMFSATFSSEIRELAKSILRDPVGIDVAPRNAPIELIDHRVYHVETADKQSLLSRIINEGGGRQSLVFTRTKHGANRVQQRLEKERVRCAAIHGNKSQGARTRALSDFKEGKIQVLVATDIAARGLDISELPHVINFELPHVPEDYVHRIGRTGRAGRTGEAVSLVSRDERDRLRAIEKMLGRTIPVSDQRAAQKAA